MGNHLLKRLKTGFPFHVPQLVSSRRSEDGVDSPLPLATDVLRSRASPKIVALRVSSERTKVENVVYLFFISRFEVGKKRSVLIVYPRLIGKSIRLDWPRELPRSPLVSNETKIPFLRKKLEVPIAAPL
jgi:hypothetical protein